MGRVTSITDPKGTVTQLLYAENGVDLLEIKNGLGSIIQTYNGYHRLASIRDRTGNPPWIFSYNIYGQMVFATDPMGVVTEYVYDASQQLVQIKRDGNIIHTLTRDSIGRVSSHTGDTGLTRNYSYNALNHITSTARLKWSPSQLSRQEFHAGQGFSLRVGSFSRRP